MRASIVALGFALLASCHSTVKAPPRPTFDGAYASDAEGRRFHGERLTYVLGCRGCHGDNLQGTLFTKNHPDWGPLYASNLTVEVPEYSDAQLDGIIRHGTHPERKTVWGMPSQIFQNLSDRDYQALVAYLRSLKPVGTKLPNPQFSTADKEDIAVGRYKPAVQMVADFKRAQPVDLGPKYALGRYVASVSCEECHGSNLAGDPISKTPDLVVAGTYTRGEFEKLITQGIPTGGRKLRPAMHDVAIGRFSHLTRHERHALYGYLKARAEQPSPKP
jgi:cytochrome c553